MCLSFSSTSTQIAFGCDNGSVGIFNLRTKELDTVFNDHLTGFKIVSVGMNCNDTELASVSETGTLIIHGLTQESGKGGSIKLETEP